MLTGCTDFLTVPTVSESLDGQYGQGAHVTVSAPETTALDLVERPQLGGGLDYVATTLGDMQAFGLLDAGELAAVSQMYPRAVVQRAGHILDEWQRAVPWTSPHEIEQDLVLARGGLGQPPPHASRYGIRRRDS